MPKAKIQNGVFSIKLGTVLFKMIQGIKFISSEYGSALRLKLITLMDPYGHHLISQL